MNRKARFIAPAVLFFVSSFALQVNADTYHHLDNLANDIEAKARELVQESRHYRHTANYRLIIAESTRICQLAAHIHEVAHVAGSVYHLESDVRQMDACFHRLKSIFDATEMAASYGRGHVHGNTKHVKRILNAMEDCIHHMQEDLAALRRARHTRRTAGHYGDYAHRAHRAHRGYDSHGSGYGVYGSGGRSVYFDSGRGHGDHGGVSLGNGRVSFRFNF